MTSVIVQRSWLRSLILGSLFFVGAIMVAFLVLVAATALGQPTPEPDPLALVGGAAKALMDHKWLYALVPIINLAVWGVRKFSGSIPWLGTDRGGAVTAVLLGAVLPIVSAVLTGQPFTAEIIVTVISVVFSAIGTFVAGKKVFAPSDKVTVPGGGMGGSAADIASRL